MVSSRGTMVYPVTSGAITDTIDQWRCRFRLRDANGDMTDAQFFELLQKVSSKHGWMHVEKLMEIDGAPGYTKAQGED
jgi:isocitrate dehydrogenase